MDKTYLEYRILNNRPGLLGAIASTIGLLRINIVSVASIQEDSRAFLLENVTPDKGEILFDYLSGIKDLEVLAFRKPDLTDFLALKHGRRIKKQGSRPPKYVFAREDLDLLVDFLSDHLISGKTRKIGFAGNPRIGKTETSIAACVHANKHWVIVSSTLVRKTARTSMTSKELSPDNVFLIDAITSWQRSTPQHIQLVERVLEGEGLLIIEHPEVFLTEKGLEEDYFDLMIELKGKEDSKPYIGHSFNSFDIS